MDLDTIVIGAGVVGLAVAEAVARSGRSVVVLERHGAFGTETSSRNSQVIHAGMYYPAGSLKARLCVPGNRSLYAWCARHAVDHARVGKYIVATSPEEEPALDGILSRASENGVDRLERVTAAEIAREEPNVRATAALWSPNTGIVDAHQFMASLVAEARAHDADFAFQHRVSGIARESEGYAVTAIDPQGEPAKITARSVINAAGLDCDTVAALAGIDDPEFRLTYVKGSYFRVRRRGFVRHLIYPVPPPKLAGLGVHVTLELDGAVRLGPDVEVLPDRRLAYEVDEARAVAFHQAASRYLPDLRLDEVYPDQSGIRPKLTPSHGGVPDFVIREESARGLPGLVNLIGIESPGLTCALEIGTLVETMLP